MSINDVLTFVDKALGNDMDDLRCLDLIENLLGQVRWNSGR